ncbi:hypothetical protein [Olleya sp. HaHaR_3_96]|uniref:hypothetical protein n=1 Tax=Olleya sp. HaHaR_3_96 TaxID=2745560 RepID=UPI001C4FB300|nr:hypothetical protein [Olleya sp. HaHaR_3_96]QXP59318.1 hypothetical protein H0I26_15540 [Olleya sp. HaHaR_3_96]
MTKFKTLFITLFVIIIYTCKAQESRNNIFIEGKWKVVNWIFTSNVGRSMDKTQRENYTRYLNGLTMDFSVNNIFSTNKPEIFQFNNSKFELKDSKYLLFNNVYLGGAFILKKQKVFFRNKELTFELEKIESYPNPKIVLNKVEDITEDLPGLLQIEQANSLNQLDVLPKLISSAPDDYDCSEICLSDIFTNVILNNIDYSLLKNNDIKYDISFVIDSLGNINSFNVKETYIYWNEKGTKVVSREEKNKELMTEIKKDIIFSILKFKNRFKPGVKNNKDVNSVINLELRLISQ